MELLEAIGVFGNRQENIDTLGYDSIRKEQAELHLKMIRLHKEIEKLKEKV